jgi:toxin-antitoxin system PIN domain toxin
VNVLVALAWPTHQHHGAAHRWFAESRRRTWATTPLTELGFVRVSSSPAFSAAAVSPHDALKALARFREHPRCRVWSELPPVSALSSLRLLGHQQIADAYLVLVARHHRGVLATFDARIASWAGADDVLTIPA